MNPDAANPDPVNPDPAAAGQLVLRDIHVPGADWWPPAPGWWLLAILLIAVLYGAWRLARMYFYNRRQRKAIEGAYQQVRERLLQSPDAGSVANASEFLRQVALNRYPRHEVAGLSGAAWLEFLDQSGGGDGFRNGPGAVLGDLAYRADTRADIDAPALVQLIQSWLNSQLKRRERRS